MSLKLVIAKIIKNLRKNGLRATLSMAFGSEGMMGLLRRKAKIDAFDQQYGTDTAGIVPLWKLSLESPNAIFGIKYQASYEQEIRDAVSLLPVDPREYTFVDFGCGKGRVLLVAANLGFREVIGVEFAHELADIAKKNLAIMRVANAVIVEGDAANYRLNCDNAVIYFYNPFGEEVMAKVISNLKEANARNLFVVYVTPNCADLLDQSGFLTRLGSPAGQPDIQVWRRSDPISQV
jgi:SAM-dependent methyltransferase